MHRCGIIIQGAIDHHPKSVQRPTPPSIDRSTDPPNQTPLALIDRFDSGARRGGGVGVRWIDRSIEGGPMHAAGRAGFPSNSPTRVQSFRARTAQRPNEHPHGCPPWQQADARCLHPISTNRLALARLDRFPIPLDRDLMDFIRARPILIDSNNPTQPPPTDRR